MVFGQDLDFTCVVDAGPVEADVFDADFAKFVARALHGCCGIKLWW